MAAAVGSEGLRGPDSAKSGSSEKYTITWKNATSLNTTSSDPASEGRTLLAEGKSRILVQWNEIPDGDLLASAGVTLIRYVPRNTWIARISEETDWDALSSHLRWVGRIPSGAKIDPAITAGDAGKTGGMIPVRVRFHEGTAPAEAEQMVHKMGGQTYHRMAVLNRLDLLIPTSSLNDLAEADEVFWIGAPLPPPVPANDGIRENGNIDSLHAAPCSLSGSGVIAGVWDGGRIDAHDDFSGRLHVIDSGSPISTHATHVAGTLGSSGLLSASLGGDPGQWRGVAPACTLLSYDFYGDILTEIGDAVSTGGIDLASNSWVLDINQALYNNCYLYGDYDGYAPEFDEIVTGYFGRRICIVMAAGNERNDGDCSIDARSGYACIPPPGTAKNVITVGAINTDNSTMTMFSGYGPIDDGRVKPDIVAGGCQTTPDYSVHSTWPGNTYASNFFCGTSMSTPAVSGALALLIEAHRGLVGGGTDPMPSTLKALLLGSADDLGNPGPDYRFGYGRMNVKRAVDFIQTETVITDSVGDGGSSEWTFAIPAGVPSLKITLVWDDPAGVPLANPALVNDLDLLLETPSGTPLYPYVLDPANPAMGAVTGEDHLNNVEQIEVAAPAAGVWTVQVTGGNVPAGPSQIFSLVGIDTLPPATPDPFTVVGSTDSTIELACVCPADVDFAEFLLVRSASPISWIPSAGSSYSIGETVGSDVFVIDAATVFAAADSALMSGTEYHYRLFARDGLCNYSAGLDLSCTTTGSCTSVQMGGDIPNSFTLHPARPNPFNALTTLRFELPRSGPVRLEIYTVNGRLVKTLVDTVLPSGIHEEQWNGTGNRGEEAASGVYFAHLTAPDNAKVTKLILVR